MRYLLHSQAVDDSHQKLFILHYFIFTFQVDLGKITNLTGVATQGGNNEEWWVTSYVLKFATISAKHFEDYIENEFSRVRR